MKAATNQYSTGNTVHCRGQDWPRLYQRTYRSGVVGYMVDCGRVNGKRNRRTFPTKPEAETYRQQKLIERTNDGIAALAVPIEVRREAAKCQSMLAPYDASLTQATEYYVEHVLRYRTSPTLREMIDRLLAEKTNAGLREVAIYSLRLFFDKVVARRFGERRLDEITLEEWKEVCLVRELAPRTQFNRVRMLGQLNNYALRHHWVSDNLAKELIPPEREDKEPQILTVDEARRLLKHAGEFELLAYIAIGLFAGVRSAELARLDWSAIKLDDREIVIGAKVAKTRSRRVVPIDEPLASWLTLCARTQGTVIDAKTFPARFSALRKAAGIARWAHNGLRHSFASYHLAKWKNPVLTAYLMGHRSGTDMLDSHYKSLASGIDAEKYWQLRPSQFEPESMLRAVA